MLSKLIATVVLAVCLLLPTPASAFGTCVTEQTHEIVWVTAGQFVVAVVATHTTTCCSDNREITCTVVTTYNIV